MVSIVSTLSFPFAFIKWTLWGTQEVIYWAGMSMREGHKNWQMGSFKNFKREKIVLQKIIKKFTFNIHKNDQQTLTYSIELQNAINGEIV